MAHAFATPPELRYTPEHEWIALPKDPGGGKTLRIGITDFAQDALGDVVYTNLSPVGTKVIAGEPLGEIESTKSVSDIYSPLSGVIANLNPALQDQPELINREPYGEGWLLELRVEELAGMDALLDSTEYGKLTSNQAQ